MYRVLLLDLAYHFGCLLPSCPIVRTRLIARRAVAAVSTVVLGASILLAPAASADTIADKKAQAQQLTAQIDQLNTRLEQLAERYNAARLKADSLKTQAAKAAAAVATAKAQMDQRRSAVRQVAVDAYTARSGPETAKPVADGNALAVSQVYASSVVSGQHDALDALRQSQLDYTDQQHQLAAAETKARSAVNEVAKDQQAAASADRQARAALGKVQGDLAQLVAEEQARQAAAAAERARAELARQQATAASRSRTLGPAPGSAPPPGHGAGAAVAEAQRQIGKPYEWGAAGPNSFDCSGLTMWAWRAGGVSLPHYTKAQYDATTHVSLSDLQPGDLVFFGSDFHHEGLYVGNGQMIEAPHSGADVRYASIYRSDLIAASRPG
jgi:cell wall-associated NlpC family hydrolase/outer membrane murein-binding lipoprotein Lpp